MASTPQEERMSNPDVAPPGWYPAPDGTGGQRWWDGTQWTQYASPLAPPPVPPHVATQQYGQQVAPHQLAPHQLAPYGEVAQPRVPEGTPVDTAWIWLIVALPLLSIVPLLFRDFEGYLVQSMNDPSDPMAQLGLYTDPAYLSAVALGWLSYGLSVWFSYLDAAALRRLGYPRRFHWAWSFLWSLVYVIGRSVVVKRQAGRGSAPMWVAIALTVALFVGSLVWVFSIVASVVSTTIGTVPSV
jgi:Protein of unknown function (DUF2510)